MNILPHLIDSASNYMDISKCLVVKVVNGLPGKYLDLVKGFVLQKDIPIKNMISKFHKPNVLVFQNSLDEACVKLKF